MTTAPITTNSESNARRETLGGSATGWDTCPILFGEPGANARHSLIQLVHRGTRMVPVDFILTAEADHGRPKVYRALAANALGQAAALMRGRSETEDRAEMTAAGASEDKIARVAPHRVGTGEWPSNTILFRRPDSCLVGPLIALYECKPAPDCLRGIDGFEQWGAKPGKQTLGTILPPLSSEEAATAADPVTASAVGRLKASRGEH